MNVKNIAKESAKCKKLDLIENEAILLLFGKGCQSLCTTIAQVYEVNHNRWTKKCSGVLCFIKDNTRRSYYMRMYCLILHEMVWEQEIYYELVIERLRSFFLQFEGNREIIGLNFCFEDEASDFMSVVMTTIANRNRRRQERNQLNAPPVTPQNAVQHEKFQTISVTKISKKDKNSNKKKSKNKKIDKTLIGAPRIETFVHITHVGHGGARSISNAPEIKQLLSLARISENQLEDPVILRGVHEFVDKHHENIRQSFMPQNHSQQGPPQIPQNLPPPELPGRTGTMRKDSFNRLAPLAPPMKPKIAAPPPPGQKILPPAPQAPGVSGSGPPPPPMPPPAPIGGPPFSMNPIIKSEKPTQIPITFDPREELLASIRNFKSGQGGLKKVDLEQKAQPVPEVPNADSLAKSLNNFLKAREQVVRDSSDSEESDDSEEWKDD